MNDVYAVQAAGSRIWTWLLLLFAAMSLIIAVALAADGAEAGVVVSVLALAVGEALLTLILPRRYELGDGSLAIVFPVGRWRIPFETIEHVRPARGFEPYGFIGVRFATSPAQAVTVLRRDASFFRRPNLVISPAGRAAFIERLREALGARDAKAP